MKRYLLKNTHLCGTYTIEKKIFYFLKNICSFDCIAQIVFTSAVDNSAYLSIIKESNNSFFQFIIKFMEIGPTSHLYKERFLLLKLLYEETKNVIKTENHDVIYSDNKRSSYCLECTFTIRTQRL